MKTKIALFSATAVIFGICASTGAFAKTAKDCIAEWRADKAGMQARGTTEKAYVEQCKGGAEPTAAVPAAPPPQAAPPTPRQATASGNKTAKDCIAEWRADKAGMQARGTTQKAYVEQCRGGSVPAASAPASPTATAAAPAPSALPTRTGAASSQKTAKECVAEWRADKAGMQARGTTEKAYVEQCRNGGAMPTATAPTPTAAPAPVQPTPTQTEATPAPAPRRAAPTTTTATPAPVPALPSAPGSTATLEAGQFADDASARASCPTDTVVWVNLPSKIYHFAGTKNYGTTKRGVYMCEKVAIASQNRASKTETHP